MKLFLVLLLAACASQPQRFEGESMVDEALSKKEYSEAIENCQRAFIRDQKNPFILIKIASIQKELGDLVGAEASLLQATEIDQNHTAHKELLRLYLFQKDWVKAKQLLDPLLEKYPNDPELLNMMGVWCDQRGQYQQALDYFNKAEQAGSDNLASANNIALTLAKLGKNEEAIAKLQYVLGSDQTNRTAFNLATVLVIGSKEQEALNMLKSRITPFEAERAIEHIKGEYAQFIRKK